MRIPFLSDLFRKEESIDTRYNQLMQRIKNLERRVYYLEKRVKVLEEKYQRLFKVG